MSGIIDVSKLNAFPEKHELETAKYFAARGHDIVFLAPSNIPGAHTPDILMDGVEWEIKAPKGKSKRTIEQNFRHAVAQSRYIIFDLRRINAPESQCLSQLYYRFNTKTYVKRLLIIKKNGVLIDLTRKNS